MPSIVIPVRVSAIGGTSFTLTPTLGPVGTAGAMVDGSTPAGSSEISSGITTIVVNSAGAPDSNFARHLNQVGVINIELGA